MTINGRLLLLVAAMGLFVRIWSATDQVRGPNRSKTSRPAVQIDSWSNAASFTAASSDAYYSISPKPRSTPGGEETWTATSCPIPLPAGIVSGMYRVVNDAGRVACLDIAPSPAPAQNASATMIAPEFYITTIGATRWYFIRQQLPVDQQPIVQSPPIHQPELAPIATECCLHPLRANKKFDFTGYATTNELDESAAEEVALPEPPDMPVPQ